MNVLNTTLISLSPTARRILTARFWRSIAQGVMAVDLVLYLSALNWSGAAIGAVVGGAGITSATLGLVIGYVTDRFGRKQFLLAYETMCCLCGLVALFTTHPVLLTAAIVLADFGRGANGAAGPFAPAEDAWLAESVEPATRGVVFSLKSAIGFTGMALGALLAMLPALWTATLGPAQSYRPLFLIVILGNASNLFILGRIPNQIKPTARKGDKTPTPAQPPKNMNEPENKFLRRLMTLNMLNGFSVGLITPLMSYWFEQRFGVGPVLIAPVMAATFLGVAMISVFSGGLARRAGLVNVFVGARGSGLVLLLLLPMMPFYGLAALIHVLRSAINNGTIGVRQALLVSAVRDKRRGLASSLNTFSGRLPQSIGPTVAGSLIGAGWFMAPFCIAAIFQGAYLFLFRRLFHQVEHSIKQQGLPTTGAIAKGSKNERSNRFD